MSRANRAVVSAIGTILLVAVTVILATSMLVFTLALSQSTSEFGSAVAFDVEKNGTEDGNLLAIHMTGETIPVEQFNVVNGEIVEPSLPEETLQAGDSVEIVPKDEVVRLVWEKKSTAQLLKEIEGPFETDSGPLGGSAILAIVDEGEGLDEGDEYNRNFTLRYVNTSDKNNISFKVFARNNSGNIAYIKTFRVGTETYPSEFTVDGASASDDCFAFYDGKIVDINDNPASRYDVEIEIERDC